MAKKTRCPGCGARNPVTQHRCRVCTTIVNPDAPEAQPRGMASPPRNAAGQDAAREVNERPFDASELEAPLATPSAEPMPPEPMPMAPEPVPMEAAEPLPMAAEPTVAEPMGMGIEIDAVPRNADDAPPPLVYEADAFDP